MSHPFLDTQTNAIDSFQTIEKNARQSWLVVLTAALFFFYEFAQMNLFNSISSSLMQAFQIHAAQLGVLSSFYFIANVIFLFFAGILLDRVSTRFIILSALLICIVGTALFSISHSFAWACFFRFLTGIGSAFCFLSVIRLASRWFSAHRMALAIGVVVTMAMIGGWVSQTPMTLLVKAVDWRVAMQIDAALGMIFFILILQFVKDYPSHHQETHLAEKTQIQTLGYLKSMRLAFLRAQNWLVGFYVFTMNLPLGLLGGLWGVLYLTNVQAVSKIEASEISSMLFLGTLVGSPLIGWVSDYLHLRRLPMILSAAISAELILFLLFASPLSFMMLIILFFLLGLCTSAQIIGYPFVAENSARMITAMSVSVVNISVQGGIGLFQPFFGFLLDQQVLSRAHHLSAPLIASDFHWAMWIFPIGFIVAIGIALTLLQETHCKQRGD